MDTRDKIKHDSVGKRTRIANKENRGRNLKLQLTWLVVRGVDEIIEL